MLITSKASITCTPQIKTKCTVHSEMSGSKRKTTQAVKALLGSIKEKGSPRKRVTWRSGRTWSAAQAIQEVRRSQSSGRLGTHGPAWSTKHYPSEPLAHTLGLEHMGLRGAQSFTIRTTATYIRLGTHGPAWSTKHYPSEPLAHTFPILSYNTWLGPQ